MERHLRADAAAVLAVVGRHWGWVLTFGIVTLLAGLLALAWPGRTVLVLAVLLVVQSHRAMRVRLRPVGHATTRIAAAT